MKRTTLILLACSALLLGGYALLGQRGVEVPEAGRVLPGFDPRQVQALQIERPGRPVIRLSRRSGSDHWRLTEPVSGRADRAAVAAILSRLEFLEPVRQLTETNLKQLGLSPPAVKLTLQRGAAREVLELGRPDPSGRGVYLRVGSRRGRALVVERELLDAVGVEADALRSPALLTLEAAALRSVDVKAARGRFRLLRGAKAGWTLQLAGHTLRAHPLRSARLVAALLGLRASRFTARPAAAVAQVRLELTHAGTSGQRRLALAIGGPCTGQPEERWVVVGRVEACVPAKALQPLLLPGDRLRDLSVSWRQEHELAAITVRGAKGSVSLLRDGGAWFVGRGATRRPAAHARVRAWVDALRGLSATLEPCTAQRQGGLGLGRAEVVLGLDGEDRRETLRIGAVSGERQPLRRGAEQAVLWVDAQALGRLLEVGADHFTEQAKP